MYDVPKNNKSQRLQRVVRRQI